MAKKPGKMAQSTRASIARDRSTAMAATYGAMGQPTWETGSTTRSMDQVSILGRTAVNTQACGKRTRCTALVT